jgi:hypothetical protein
VLLRNDLVLDSLVDLFLLLLVKLVKSWVIGILTFGGIFWVISLFFGSPYFELIFENGKRWFSLFEGVIGETSLFYSYLAYLLLSSVWVFGWG